MNGESPFRIKVLSSPLGPAPRPEAFEIQLDGRTVAWLTAEQVHDAVDEWRQLKIARETALKRT